MKLTINTYEQTQVLLSLHI